MQSVPTLHESRNLQLRRTVPNDAGILFERGFSQREFMRLFRLNDSPQSVGDVQQRLGRQQQVPPDQNTYLELLILHRRYGPIGLCALADYLKLHRRAEYLIGLFDTAQRQTGYGIEVTLMVLDLAFNAYAMHKVYAATYAYNQPAQRNLLGMGFQLEGIARQHVFDQVAQQFVDVHNYGLLEAEFRQHQRLKPLAQRFLGRDITLPGKPPAFQPRDDTDVTVSGTRLFSG